jgi:hypothetical protein
MGPWPELIKIALLGTERQTESIHAEGSLGATLARIYPPNLPLPSMDREKALLDATAVLALYHQCGQQPEQVRGETPEPTVPDERPMINSTAVRHLLIMIIEGHHRPALPEWLQALNASGKCLPSLYLPELLEAGRQDKRLIPLIVPVLGNRGHWLARLNEDWAYAASVGASSTEEWEEGSSRSRVRYLEELRLREPDQTRTLIESVWKQEPARQRAAFLDTLEPGLTMADEPFLEGCLEDRSQEVRQHAAQLLACLVESRLSARMRQRVEPLIRFRPATGRAGQRKGTFEVILPEAWDSAWERDGLKEKAPSGKGKKAWWLEQMLFSVPPSYWSRTWDITPETLIHAALSSDWRGLLISAWTAAAVRHQDMEWAEALLQKQPEQGDRLWPVLPPERREAIFSAWLQRVASKADELRPLLVQLPTLEGVWSQAFTLTVAQACHQWMDRHRKNPDYTLSSALHASAWRMAPGAVEDIEAIFGKALLEQSPWQKVLDEVLETLSFRRDMLQAIAAA